MTLDNNNGLANNLYSIIHQEYKIIAEYKMIQNESIEGVYVIPSHGTSFLWFGVIFVREGIYTDGIFRFNISLPNLFPNTPEQPTVTFQSDVFHPLICPETGLLDTSEIFDDWHTNGYHIWQLLKYIQFIFTNAIGCATAANDSSIVNKDAMKLIHDNQSEFLMKINECVRISKSKIYDSAPTIDKHYITFERFDDGIHGPVLESIKNKTDISMSPPTSGLSWVNEGEFKPLSK